MKAASSQKTKLSKESLAAAAQVRERMKGQPRHARDGF